MHCNYFKPNFDVSSTIFKLTVVVCLIFLNETKSNDLFGVDRNTLQKISNRTDDKIQNLNDSPKLFCFYVFTKDFKPGIMKDLCTHIIVGFFSINTQNYTLHTSPENFQILNDLTNLKQKKPLQIMISVGGANDQSFILMVSNHTTRKKFIQNTMSIIKKFKIDGLDLDWEWPAFDGIFKEKIKFIQLLREVRTEFDRHKKKYILSVDVSSQRIIIELGYYVQYIAQFVDFVNVMCYDYHFYTKLYPLTGFNAPLYSSTVDLLSNFNINYSINYWISQSMPREKIVMGVPTYGHTYKLLSSRKHDLKAPAQGYGSVGYNGFADYRQICDFISQNNATVIYDNISKVPYAYHDMEWISFDNEMSLVQKVDYALKENLSGIMVFSVNADDYLGVCNHSGIILPLINKIRSILFNEV